MTDAQTAAQVMATAWGGRPASLRTAERVARNKLAKRATLVPLHGERYLAAAPPERRVPFWSDLAERLVSPES